LMIMTLFHSFHTKMVCRLWKITLKSLEVRKSQEIFVFSFSGEGCRKLIVLKAIKRGKSQVREKKFSAAEPLSRLFSR
jgi:hypothetical protein